MAGCWPLGCCPMNNIDIPTCAKMTRHRSQSALYLVSDLHFHIGVRQPWGLNGFAPACRPSRLVLAAWQNQAGANGGHWL